MSKPDLVVFQGDYDWIVCHGRDDLRAAIDHAYGAGHFDANMMSLDEYGELPPGALIAINLEEAPDIEAFAPTYVCAKSGSTKARKTAAEWAALNGRGLLCSLEC